MKWNGYLYGVRYTFTDDPSKFIKWLKDTIGHEYSYNREYGHACFSELHYEPGTFYLALPYYKRFEEYFGIFENLFENVKITIEDKFYFKDKKIKDAYGETRISTSIVDDSNDVFVIWKIVPDAKYNNYVKSILYRVVGSMLRFFSSGEEYTEDIPVEGDFIKWLLTINNKGYSGHSIGNYIITTELLKKIDNINLLNKVVTEQNMRYPVHQSFFRHIDGG